MKSIRVILSIIFIFSLLISCKKKKWKLPTDVSFKMDINRTPGAGGKLVFTGGSIVIAEFEFDGKREQGDDAYFSKSFSGGLRIAFDPNSGVAELDFDIPQGTYTRIEIVLEAEGNGDKSIVVDATYTNTGGTSFPLKLELEESEIYSLVAKHTSGGNEIILDKDIPASATIKIDPVYWFQPVSAALLDSAELVNVGGTPTILINDEYNEDIFDIIDDRVDEATDVTFD